MVFYSVSCTKLRVLETKKFLSQISHRMCMESWVKMLHHHNNNTFIEKLHVKVCIEHFIYSDYFI